MDDYHSSEYLLIDSSKLSLEVARSVPITNTVQMKEKYGNWKVLLKARNYEKYEQQLCGKLLVHCSEYRMVLLYFAISYVSGIVELKENIMK